MDVDKEWFKKQLFAIVYYTAHESELTLREMVQALHEVAEHVMFLEEKKPDDDNGGGQFSSEK